jgi:hypothetical protein
VAKRSIGAGIAAHESRPERAQDKSRSGVPAGTRKTSFDLFRWLRCAPPPANFHRPSGAQHDFVEFASNIRTQGAPYAGAIPAQIVFRLHIYPRHPPSTNQYTDLLFAVCQVSYRARHLMKRPCAHGHAYNRNQANQQQQRRRDECDRNRKPIIARNKPSVRERLPLGAQFEHEGDVLPDAKR